MLHIILGLLALVGAVTVLFLLIDSLWSVIQSIAAHLMPYFQPGEELSLTKKFGPWAVVTGSTDGIGKQYARELARQGLNVILISRSKEKLVDVATEIEKSFSVKTKVIQADFSAGQSVYAHIESELKGLTIGLLVNNVGKQYDYPAPLCEVETQTLWELLLVNVGATTAMTRLLLPAMAARGRGALVNVSSGAELQPLPLMTVYAATKAYIGNFTAGVRHEYASRGITVQHLSPLFVSTKMNAFSDRLMSSSLLVPDAAAYARHAVATLGKVDKTTGYWVHGIQYFFASLPPVWIRTKIGGAMNEKFRQEYLDKIKHK